MNTDTKVFAEYIRDRQDGTPAFLDWLTVGNPAPQITVSGAGITLAVRRVADGYSLRLSAPSFMHPSNQFEYLIPSWSRAGLAEFLANARFPQVAA